MYVYTYVYMCNILTGSKNILVFAFVCRCVGAWVVIYEHASHASRIIPFSSSSSSFRRETYYIHTYLPDYLSASQAQERKNQNKVYQDYENILPIFHSQKLEKSGGRAHKVRIWDLELSW